MFNFVGFHYCTCTEEMSITRLSVALISLTAFIVHGAELSSLCGDDSWIAYEDEKCVKLFQNFATRDQAEEVCNQQAGIISAPSLVSIRSAGEQKFLVEYIANVSQFNNVWIGATRRPDSSSEFVWDDGSSVQRYTNWGIGRPTEDDRRLCVLMQSEWSREFSDMKWTDISCAGGNWFICEKLQSWSLEHFQQNILTTRRELADVKSQLKDLRDNQMIDMRNQLQDLRDNPIPVGFIYVQLQNQPEPARLWVTTAWREITAEYAGLFFRAVGQGSAAFGNIQAENSPRLTNISGPFGFNNFTGTIDVQVNANGQQSTTLPVTGSLGSPTWGIRVQVSSGEVRPRNTAMRIWIRTG